MPPSGTYPLDAQLDYFRIADKPQGNVASFAANKRRNLRLLYERLTGSTTALFCFGLKGKNSRSIFERLRERKVHVRVGSNYLRISSSVFNNVGDIDKLLEALV
jgi:selenocysteine lyase/cysteine desulfurase